MSMPDGEVTQAQLDMLAGGDSSSSVGGEVDNANTPAEELTSTDFLSADSVYADLPTAFRDGKMLDGIISNVNSRHAQALAEAKAKYEAYDAFLDKKPEDLGYAFQIFQMMDTPEGAQKVFNALVNTYGFSTQQAAQAVQQIAAVEEEPPEELTPEQQKIKELEGKIEEFSQFRQNQEQAYHQQVIVEEERIFGENLDNAMSKVFQSDPELANDVARRDDLVERVVYAFERNLKAGGNISVDKMVQDAWQQQRAYNQHVYDRIVNQNRSSSQSAPRIMNPTGSNPGGNNGFDPKDEKARDAEMVRRLEELQHLS